MSVDKERSEAMLAAIVCRSANFDEQLKALEGVTSATPLRLLLALFGMYNFFGDREWEWDYEPHNSLWVCEELMRKVDWQTELGCRPPVFASWIMGQIYRCEAFQRRVRLLGGFYAPMDTSPEAGDDPWNDWRQGATIAIRMVPGVASTPHIYDAQLAQAVLDNPKGPDAWLLADQISDNKAILQLAKALAEANPELANFLFGIVDR